MAQPAPAAAIPTLPEFLGIPQAFKGTVGLVRHIGTCITSQLGGRFPGLEPRPPLLPLSDPANLSPDAPPSVQTAAKIKQDQDAGAQKAKAAEYLATVGCGCYEGVAEALAENLKDCNEEVRYATVKALRDIGSRSSCACGGNSCCTPEVYKGLMRLAWEVDDSGCFVETSQRVRRLARLALNTCGSIVVPPGADGLIPEEGPELEEGELLSKSKPRQPAEAVAVSADEPATAVRPAAHRSAEASGILAEVNGEPLEAEAVLRETQRRLRIAQPHESATDSELYHRLYDEVLEEAIDRKILAQTARVVLSSAVQSQLGQPVAQASGAAAARTDADPAARTIRSETALAKELLRRQVDHDPYVSPQEIEAFYADQTHRYRHADQYRWQHFWIDHADIADRDEAVKIMELTRLRVAGFRTEPPTDYDDRCVRVERFDWMTADELAEPAMKQRLRSLHAGEASELESSAATTSFIVVHEIRPGQRRPLPDVAAEIKAEILARRRTDAEALYIKQLRSQAVIQLSSVDE